MIRWLRRHIACWRLGRNLYGRDGFVLISLRLIGGASVWEISAGRQEHVTPDHLYAGAHGALLQHEAAQKGVPVICSPGTPGVAH